MTAWEVFGIAVLAVLAVIVVLVILHDLVLWATKWRH